MTAWFLEFADAIAGRSANRFHNRLTDCGRRQHPIRDENGDRGQTAAIGIA